MMRTTAILLLASTALAACGENDRREFLYKPAYCLAGGLAEIGSEACLPQKLKDDAAAVAQARLIEPEAPTVAKNVYYTDDQRLAMGIVIAETMFTPNEKLTRSSVAMSLDANELVPHASCDAKKVSSRATTKIAASIAPRSINRETALFLSKHYSDVQLSELYRVAKENGTLADVSDDAFIIADPKNAKKTVNVKPQSGRAMGSILSYTTSSAVSQYLTKNRSAVVADIAAIEAEVCPVVEPTAPAPVIEEVTEKEGVSE